MVADWFAGREIATAMGVFVNSWPVGIGLGLVALPAIAAGGGLIAALGAATGLVVLGFALLAAFYRDPAAASGPAVVAAWPRGAALRALSAAAGVWALYNAALAMVFGFGPLILVERGLSLAQSGAVTSLMMWTAALSIPLGGLLADRTGRRDLVITVGLLGNAAGLLAAQTAAPPAVVFAVMGLVGGLPAGAIMSLPAAALGPAVRAAGMGLFFTLYYLVMLLAPPLVGGLAERLGGPSVAFDAGAVMLAAACALLLAYRAAMARLLMP
jgi:MFS family permease